MGITAISGPHISYGLSQASSGLVTEYNEERAPDVSDLGYATLDPRPNFNYRPGSPVGTQIKGLYGGHGLVDYYPFTANASAISPSTGNAPVIGTALTLTPLASFGAIQTTIIAPETGLSVSVIAIDSTAAVLTFGSGGTVATWNPAAGSGRVISVTTSSSVDVGSGVTYTVAGRDMYGFKMTETISASTQSSVGIGKKAFKYISGVSPSTNAAITSTGVKIGFVDTFGFPLNTGYFGLTSVVISTAPTVPNLTPLTSVNATVASTVATATSTTPDARGTYTSSIATAGTTTSIPAGTAVRITISQNITATMASAITASDQTAMFGIAQYSSV